MQEWEELMSNLQACQIVSLGQALNKLALSRKETGRCSQLSDLDEALRRSRRGMGPSRVVLRKQPVPDCHSLCSAGLGEFGDAGHDCVHT